MSTLKIFPIAQALKGQVLLPSDKSISHRSLIFAALGFGTSHLTRFSYGEDNVNTLRAMRQMGVEIADDGRGTVTVHGVGLDGLKSGGELDCGNSGTTMRLLSGVLAAQTFQSRLVGDASLSGRPMLRVAGPLRQRGALIEGRPHPKRAGDITAPLVIGPLPFGKRLSAIEYVMPMSSAQVKSALLLSGLYADGPTIVTEPVVSRDHTERMMRALGIPFQTEGTTVRLTPPPSPRAWGGFSVDLPGDLSAAAFPLVAAAIVPKSSVTTLNTGLNPTRTGICDILQQLGARLEIEPQSDVLGEPVGALTVSAHGSLKGARVGGEVATRAIDEIPIACALAARADGTTTFTDVAELRVKESDRISTMAALLRQFGLECEEHPDGMTIQGQPERPLKAARFSSKGDHRIAMTAAVLGLVADGPTVVEDADCIATSFPSFVDMLRQFGATVEVSS
jgi:3-phosphoshikimate 1-carboxyvinyltransferase